MAGTLLTLTLLAAPAAPLPPRDARTQGPPPRVMVASVGEDGRPRLLVSATRMRTVTETVAVEVGGRIEYRTRTVQVPVAEQRVVYLDEKGVEVYRTSGKRVDPKDMRKFVKQGTPVLVSADGKPVAPAHLRRTPAVSLVVVAPALATPAPPGPRGSSPPRRNLEPRAGGQDPGPR